MITPPQPPNPFQDQTRMKVFLDGAAAAFRQAFGEGKAELMHGQFDAFRVAQITGSDEDADLLVVSVRFAVRAKKSRLVLVDAVGGPKN